MAFLATSRELDSMHSGVGSLVLEGDQILFDRIWWMAAVTKPSPVVERLGFETPVIPRCRLERVRAPRSNMSLFLCVECTVSEKRWAPLEIG